MKTRTRAETAIARVLDASERRWSPSGGEPFKTLIRTILSQNTNWRNEETAYRRLEVKIGVTPEKLALAPMQEIAEAIKPAGMYNLRSLTIQSVSHEVLDRFNGDLSKAVSKPYEEAREELMSLPGVGEKTADVVLLFSVGRHVIPVDRHIARIAKRLELVPQNAPYDEIRRTLEEATPPNTYLDTHIKLIQFGRDTCRAQNPRCPSCILNDICPYPLRKDPENPLQNKQPQTSPQNRKRAK